MTDRYAYYVRLPLVYTGTAQEYFDAKAREAKEKLGTPFVIVIQIFNDGYYSHDYIEKL